MSLNSISLPDGTRYVLERQTPPAPPSGNVRKLRRWGDPVMTAWGYDTKQVGLSNWQNIALWNEHTGFGAISNYLWIERLWIDYLRSIQFDGFNGVGEYHNKDSKMNWLCRDKGAMYLDAGGWKTADRIKWGTTAVGANNVTVEEYRVLSVWDKSVAGYRDTKMARVKCFRKSDFERPLEVLLAEGIVHRCYTANMPDNGFSDSPKGIVYSPMWSPLDWDFGGTQQPTGFWIPEVLMESA